MTANTYCVSLTKTGRLMLFKEIITVSCEKSVKQTPCILWGHVEQVASLQTVATSLYRFNTEKTNKNTTVL
jgi:hypothetical protein